MEKVYRDKSFAFDELLKKAKRLAIIDALQNEMRKSF